jgi:hypothetical protein
MLLVLKVKIPSIGKRFSPLHSNQTNSRPCAAPYPMPKKQDFPTEKQPGREAHQSLTNSAEEKNRGIKRKKQTEYPPHPRNKISPPTSLTQVTHKGASSFRVPGPGLEQLEEGGRDQVINQNAEHRPTTQHRKQRRAKESARPSQGNKKNMVQILYTVSRTPWTGDQPIERPLPTQNKQHGHPSLEWDLNQQSQHSSEGRQFMP